MRQGSKKAMPGHRKVGASVTTDISRGQYLFTLVATDVASGWTECMGYPASNGS
jgi:hypothetical protein